MEWLVNKKLSGGVFCSSFFPCHGGSPGCLTESGFQQSTPARLPLFVWTKISAVHLYLGFGW